MGLAALMAITGLILSAPGRTAAEADEPRLLILDDDVGMHRELVREHGSWIASWLPLTDPDGGLELIYALRAPGVQVLGITCSMGCSTTEVCMASAQKLLELMGIDDVPVLRGAESPADLGRPSAAALFIISAVMSHPGQVEIVATAPLTNLATAMMLEPCLAANWKALHVGTGEFLGALGESSDAARFRWTGYQDLNINVDPEAAAYVLAHAGRFHLYPNEIMDDASITMSERAGLKRRGTALPEWVAAEIGPVTALGATLGRLAGYQGMYLHGVIPLAVALDPALSAPPRELRVVMSQAKPGGYYFALTDDPAVPARPVYAKLADPEALEQRLLDRCR